MKILYLTFFLVLTTTSGFAQRSINVKLWRTMFSLKPLILGDSSQKLDSGDTLYYDGVTKHYFAWHIAFLGPDSLWPGDTIHVKNAGGYWRVPVDTGMHLTTYDTIGLLPAPWVILPMPTFPQTPPQFWTDSVWVTSGPLNTSVTDPDLSDNSDTTPVTAFMQFYASVKEARQETRLSLSPNPASDVLNIEFYFGERVESVTIALIDMTGRRFDRSILYNLSGQMHHTVNVSDLPAGIYMAELRYGEECVMTRVSIK